MEELDDEELLFTRINNGVASNKEIFDYIKKLKREIDKLNKCLDGAYDELEELLEE